MFSINFFFPKDDASDEETYLRKEMDDSISEAWLNVSEHCS